MVNTYMVRRSNWVQAMASNKGHQGIIGGRAIFRQQLADPKTGPLLLIPGLAWKPSGPINPLTENIYQQQVVAFMRIKKPSCIYIPTTGNNRRFKQNTHNHKQRQLSWNEQSQVSHCQRWCTCESPSWSLPDTFAAHPLWTPERSRMESTKMLLTSATKQMSWL